MTCVDLFHQGQQEVKAIYSCCLMINFSRVMWVHLIKNNNEALDVFKKFRAQVEDGMEDKVKMFRSNRGGEFTLKEFVSCILRGSWNIKAVYSSVLATTKWRSGA